MASSLLNYSIEVTTQPDHEPVTLKQATDQLRVTDPADFAHITRLIKAGREEVETHTHRALVTQTVVEKFDDFPEFGNVGNEFIELHRPVLQSVTSVAYIDTDGNSQTWATSNYEVDTARTPGAIWQAHGVSWPSTRAIQNAVTVTYVAGYGDADDVPERAKQAILLWVQANFDGACELPMAYWNLIQALRWH